MDDHKITVVYLCGCAGLTAAGEDERENVEKVIEAKKTFCRNCWAKLNQPGNETALALALVKVNSLD